MLKSGIEATINWFGRQIAKHRCGRQLVKKLSRPLKSSDSSNVESVVPKCEPAVKPSSFIPSRNPSESVKAFEPKMQMARVKVHIPLIKFIGARLPRPQFDSSKFPALSVNVAQVLSNNANNTVYAPPQSPPEKVTPEAPSVEKTSHKEAISFSELPDFLRPRPITEEECEAINSGGSYGLH